jgi:hypothetical protein
MIWSKQIFRTETSLRLGVVINAVFAAAYALFELSPALHEATSQGLTMLPPDWVTEFAEKT